MSPCDWDVSDVVVAEKGSAGVSGAVILDEDAAVAPDSALGVRDVHRSRSVDYVAVADEFLVAARGRIGRVP